MADGPGPGYGLRNGHQFSPMGGGLQPPGLKTRPGLKESYVTVLSLIECQHIRGRIGGQRSVGHDNVDLRTRV